MKANQKSRWNRSARSLIPLAKRMLIWISLIWSTVGATAATGRTRLDNVKAQTQEAALDSVMKTVTVGLAPSLEMRENADSLLTPALLVQGTWVDTKTTAICFDAVLELNAPLCRTYVVLFARYWVCADSYRVAVAWAEPHAGSLNFPIYPPTLSMISDPNCFRISHQFVHTYDAVFAKPLGARGPFRHRFNSYPLSEIRFGEQEALDLRLRANDARRSADANGQDAAPRPARQTILLRERPITVAFAGEGPSITIGGQKRHYNELEAVDYAGGRKCILDYRSIEIRGCKMAVPSQIDTYTGDGKGLLRSARLSNFAPSGATPMRTAHPLSQRQPLLGLLLDLLSKSSRN